MYNSLFFFIRLLSICCLLCIMSNFFPLFISSSSIFPYSVFFSLFSHFILYFNVNKYALCEYYIICQTYSVIQFVHTEFHFVAFALLCIHKIHKHIRVVFSFFSDEILSFWTKRSGRGTRNWRMLMNKNAWKKESATHKQTPNKY